MALQTLSTLSNVLVNDYDSVIRDQIFQKTVLLSKLKKNVGVQAMKNNNFLVKLRSTGHSGVYFDNGAAGADLNTGQPTYDEATVPARFGFGTHQITDSALEAANGDAGAIVDIAEDFAQAVVLSMQKSLNRQFYQRGGTEANNAVLATVNGASSGTTVTLDEGSGSDSAGPGLGTWFLYEGSLIDIGTDAQHGADTDDEITVNSVDSSTVITISGATSVADADHVKFRDADNVEIEGLRSAIDSDNTYLNVSRTNQYWAQSYVDETAEALDEGDMVSALLQANKVGSVNVILTSDVLYRKYASLLTSMKKTANSVEVLGGGFTGLEFASGGPGVGVVLDWDCPYGDMDFVTVDKGSLVIGELASGWMNRDGNVLKATNLRASYWGTYRFYGNLISRAFRAHARLGAKTA